MKKTLKFLALTSLMAVLCVACGGKDIPQPLKKQHYKQAENGVFYKFTKENKDGRIGENGDVICGVISLRFNDSTLNTSESGPISQVQPNSGQHLNILDNVNALHEGDVVTFAVMADTILAMTGNPQSLPPMFKQGNGDVLYYDITIEKIMNQEEYAAYEQEEIAKRSESDAAALKKYIDENVVATGVENYVTENGIYVITTEKGNGPKVANGKKVSVHYTGKLLDGTTFDSSVGHAPFALTIGNHEVIPGWEEGLTGLNQGTKATLIIPQEQAYGTRGAGPIPPCSSLVFDVEIVEVK